LQEALHAKAKGAPSYRFYALYDKMYRPDVLEFAYECCRANKGVAGVDGETFADIETCGRERWLGALAEGLRNKTYRPLAVKRVYIPKSDGKQRPLGIPTIRDRVAQMAAVVVLSPIFEADFQDEQYAYRPGRSALDAVKQVHALVSGGHTEVVDADLSGYFDSIAHAELMKSLARRISDKQMLHVIKTWLQAPVEEQDERGRKSRTTRNKDQGRGTPQGAPISPLLSNLYMRRFVLGWKTLGYQERLKAVIVNYADDFVICCRGSAESALVATRRLMGKLKLTVNEDKTQVCRMPEETFDFLGYTIGRCYTPQKGRAYIGTKPSRKSIRRICGEITEETSCRWGLRDTEDRVGVLNRKLTGWANYFCLGPVSKAYRAVEEHARCRLRQWLRRKHQLQTRCTSRYSDDYLHDVLGLVRLRERTRDFPWAKAGDLVREPDAGNPHVRFDERDVETEHGGASEALADERGSEPIGHA